MKINTIITDITAVVNFSGQTHSFDCNTQEYKDIVLAIREGRKDEIPNIVDLAKKVEVYSNNLFQVKNGCVYLDDRELPSALSTRILDFSDKKLPCQPLVNFARRLLNNPSYRAVQELFTFLEVNKHPITDDGMFVAYKGVTKDFKDCHTRTFDNSIGKVVSMPRNEVDEDSEQTCSRGLHCSNFQYAHTQYGTGASGVTIEVEVDPANVVAVPKDYAGAKMRTCEYRVIGLSEAPLKGDIKNYKSDCFCGDPSCDVPETDDEEKEACSLCDGTEYEYVKDFGNGLICDDCIESEPANYSY